MRLSVCAGAYSRRLGRARTRWAELGRRPIKLIDFSYRCLACECVCLSLTAGAYSRRLGQMRRRRAELGRRPIELIDFSSPCLACAYVRLSACAGVYSRRLGRARRCWAERGRREAHLTQSFLRPIYLVSFPPPPRLACSCVCLSVCAGAYSRKLAQVRARPGNFELFDARRVGADVEARPRGRGRGQHLTQYP